jgi:hypothetical protein
LDALLTTALSPSLRALGETAACMAIIVLCNHCATFTHQVRPRQGDSIFLTVLLLCNTQDAIFHLKHRYPISSGDLLDVWPLRIHLSSWLHLRPSSKRPSPLFDRDLPRLSWRLQILFLERCPANDYRYTSTARQTERDDESLAHSRVLGGNESVWNSGRGLFEHV